MMPLWLEVVLIAVAFIGGFAAGAYVGYKDCLWEYDLGEEWE